MEPNNAMCLEGLPRTSESIEEESLDEEIDVDEYLQTFVPEDGGNINSVDCTKNPGHEQFIPVLDFKLEHLPEDYQDEEILRNILLWADLTVKILVKYVSLKRPETYQGSPALFPNYKFRGSKRKTTSGTGYVYSVTPSDDVAELELNTCPCLMCQRSGVPQEKGFYFTIVTSVHIIFDPSEAERSVIECFYDCDELRSETVKCLYGISTYPQTQRDQEKMSYVICVTHDEGLAVKLQELILKRVEYIRDNCSSSFGPSVLISHPHGCSKTITVGSVLHLTVPTGGDYPTNDPILFDDETECIIPYQSLASLPMLDFAAAHGSDPATVDPSSNLTSSLTTDPSSVQSLPDVTHEPVVLSDPVTSQSTTICDSFSNTYLEPSFSNLKSDPLQYGDQSPAYLTSHPVHCDQEADSTNQFQEMSDSKLVDNTRNSSNPNKSPPQNETIFPPQNLPEDNNNTDEHTENVDPLRLYFMDESLENSITEAIPEPDHLMSITLPPRTTFTLPDTAEFARRYINMKSLFQLPTETKVCLSNGREVVLPPEAKFYSNAASIQNGYMSYEVKSCPGSSGGCMLLDGGKSFCNTLPHGGSQDDGICLCALRCYPILPSNL